jgi:hypothetical protein
MDTEQQQEIFYIIMDINEPEEEKIELFTFEDALTLWEQERKENPSKLIEIREF